MHFCNVVHLPNGSHILAAFQPRGQPAPFQSTSGGSAGSFSQSGPPAAGGSSGFGTSFQGGPPGSGGFGASFQSAAPGSGGFGASFQGGPPPPGSGGMPPPPPPHLGGPSNPPSSCNLSDSTIRQCIESEMLTAL